MPADNRPHFEHLRVDRRTRFSRMAKHCLQGLYDDVLGGIENLSASDRLDIEKAAIAEARLRMLQEQEMAGQRSPTTVAAAWHLARKAKRIVERIARRPGVRRRRP